MQQQPDWDGEQGDRKQSIPRPWQLISLDGALHRDDGDLGDGGVGGADVTRGHFVGARAPAVGAARVALVGGGWGDPAARGGGVGRAGRQAGRGVEAVRERRVGVAISLVPEQSRRGNASLNKRIDTNPTGEFLFRGIAPGNDNLFAWPASPPDSAEQNASFL